MQQIIIIIIMFLLIANPIIKIYIQKIIAQQKIYQILLVNTTIMKKKIILNWINEENIPLNNLKILLSKDKIFRKKINVLFHKVNKDIINNLNKDRINNINKDNFMLNKDKIKLKHSKI